VSLRLRPPTATACRKQAISSLITMTVFEPARSSVPPPNPYWSCRCYPTSGRGGCWAPPALHTFPPRRSAANGIVASGQGTVCTATVVVQKRAQMTVRLGRAVHAARAVMAVAAPWTTQGAQSCWCSGQWRPFLEPPLGDTGALPRGARFTVHG